MQSSSRVIKSTVVDNKIIISPPIFEAVLSSSMAGEKKDFNIEEIYTRITNEANELKTKIQQEAQLQAGVIMSKAREEAQQLMNSAKEDGFQQGYQSGYQEGFNHGVNEASQTAEEITLKADDYLKSCQESAARYLSDSQDEIIKLSVAIAKKIVNTELTINPEAIFKITEDILSKALDKSQIILKVNPRDFLLIKSRRDDLAIYVEDPNNLIIVADASINQGGLRAETPSGFIDGDIDTQLDIVLKKLLEG